MTHKHFVTLFQVFVHWTRLVSLPHVVGVITMVLPSLLHPVQQGHVLFLAWHQPQGLLWLHCLWFVSFSFCSFFLMIVVVFLHFFFFRNFNYRYLSDLGKGVFSSLKNLQSLFSLLLTLPSIHFFLYSFPFLLGFWIQQSCFNWIWGFQWTQQPQFSLAFHSVPSFLFFHQPWL